MQFSSYKSKAKNYDAQPLFSLQRFCQYQEMRLQFSTPVQHTPNSQQLRGISKLHVKTDTALAVSKLLRGQPRRQCSCGSGLRGRSESLHYAADCKPHEPTPARGEGIIIKEPSGSPGLDLSWVR